MKSSQKVVVGCRVRPLLSPQDNGKEICVIPFTNPTTTTTGRSSSSSPQSVDSNKQQQHEEAEEQQQPPTDFFSSLIFNTKKKFTFDQVFFPDDNAPPTSASSPAGIFSSMVLPLIDSATYHAYNSSLLLYGQTGAGKSHTLSSLIHPVIMTLIDRMGCQNLMFRMIEIQNDNLRDLLAPNPTPENPGEKLLLRDAGNNNNNNNNNNIQQQDAPPQTTTSCGVQLTGATVAVIESEDDAIWLFQEAFRRRATAPTGMNASSSRSHAIFSIFITLPDGRITKLDLVDLAGSERQKKTQNSGKRMKESVGINSDLLALGNVLRAVASNQNHVPYRQCKLTRLLQDSIGGPSVTTFLACVSPLTFNKDESLRTLQYSAVASTVINTPVAVAAPAPPPPAPAQEQAQEEEQDEGHSSPSQQQDSKNDNNNNPNQSKSSPFSSTSSCSNCKVLAAALDRSETHAFKLENQIADMNDTLEHAQSDLKKDERIFVMKFKEAKQLSKENEELKKRVAELESLLMINKDGKSSKFMVAAENKNKKNNAIVKEKEKEEEEAAPPTSSRFASAKVRGPIFSYDFDEEPQLPSEAREESVPLGESPTPEIFLQKMTDETRKLVVMASIGSNHSHNEGTHHHRNNKNGVASPFSFQQILMMKKMHDAQQQQQQQEQQENNFEDVEAEGPIYSLSPSPRERSNENDDDDVGFSRTFVSSTGGSRHLNFDSTSMMQQH